MIRSSVGSLFLALLAALSALAAPQGGLRASHWPYKDYDSGHSHKRQDLGVPSGVDSCVPPAGELPVSGDQELVLERIRYSQICLDQLGFTLVPEERVVCRNQCPTCTTVRGYDMSCVAERVARRSTQVDLTRLRDTKQLPSRMAPSDATDCAVPPEQVLPTSTDSNWTPFTIVGSQFFDNECLTRFYLVSLSSMPSCLPDDNACMLDRALETRDAIEDGAASDLPDLLPARHSAD